MEVSLIPRASEVYEVHFTTDIFWASDIGKPTSLWCFSSEKEALALLKWC